MTQALADDVDIEKARTALFQARHIALDYRRRHSYWNGVRFAHANRAGQERRDALVAYFEELVEQCEAREQAEESS